MTKEVKILSGVVVAIIAGLIGIFMLFNRSDKNLPSTADAGKIVRDNSHKTGTGAKVTLVEFGDYQCPACGAAYPILKKILSEYNQQITFVFRNYPLPMHKNAQVAANAAEAAAAQGKFWEMHDKLYENQKSWEASGSASDVFTGFAKDLSLDTAKFQKAIDAGDYDAIIKTDQDDGTALGVNSTPTLYLNGKTLAGYSYDEIKKAIDDALKS